MTSPLPSLRTFLALDLITVWPIETWPSPPITTLPPLRTVKMVVPCQTGGSFDACMGFPLVPPDLGVTGQGYNRRAFEANPLTIGSSSARTGPYRSSEGVTGLLKDRRFREQSEFSCAARPSSA